MGGVGIHAALGFVAQRPQAVGLTTIKIQLGHVLNAQHRFVPSHARLDAVRVRAQDRTPVDFLVVEEPVCRQSSLRRLVARLPQAARSALHQTNGPLIVPFNAQVYCLKFSACPAHRFLSTFLGEAFCRSCV